MSTTGASPVTVSVSESEPTLRSAFTVAANDPASSTPSRFSVENPDSENVTAYTPPRSCSILYWPAPSVTAERTFSISAGLEASTVTPGRTAPEASRTTPAIDAEPCAAAPAAEPVSRTNAIRMRGGVST